MHLKSLGLALLLPLLLLPAPGASLTPSVRLEPIGGSWAVAMSDEIVLVGESSDRHHVFVRDTGESIPLPRVRSREFSVRGSRVAWVNPYYNGHEVVLWNLADRAIQQVAFDTRSAPTVRIHLSDTAIFHQSADGLHRRPLDGSPAERLDAHCPATSFQASDTHVVWDCPSLPNEIQTWEMATGLGGAIAVSAPPGYRLAGDHVVWEEDPPLSTHRIMAAPLAGGPAEVLNPSILRSTSSHPQLWTSGGFAAWQNGYTIELRDLNRGITTTSTTRASYPSLHGLSDGLLAWAQRGPTHKDTFWVEVASTGEQIETPLFDARVSAMSGDSVVTRQSSKLTLVLVDRDGDGLADRDERVFGLGQVDNPDSDGDGVLDGLEDADGDGVSNQDERTLHRSDPLSNDSDGDHVLDGREHSLGSNLRSADTDGDGLSDLTEVLAGLDLTSDDTDQDGLDDRYELLRKRFDPQNPDTDGDSLGDGLEVHHLNTSPVLTDTDGDGTPDDLEDRDGDGVVNRIEAGPPTAPLDTDLDGSPDANDVDDDGDGFDTSAEDANGDGDPTNDDRDRDSTPDYLDAIPGVFRQVSTTQSAPVDPASSRLHVVWRAKPPGESDYEIFLMDRISGSVTRLTDNDVDDQEPLVDGDHVAWLSGVKASTSIGSSSGITIIIGPSRPPAEVFHHRISTGATQQLTNLVRQAKSLALRGSLLAWHSQDVRPHFGTPDPHFIWVHDLDRGVTKKVPTPAPSDPNLDWGAFRPQIGDGIVAFDWLADATGNYEIGTYQVDDESVQKRTSSPGMDIHPAIDGRHLVWLRSNLTHRYPDPNLTGYCGELVHLDLISGVETVLGADVCGYELDGTLVVWTEYVQAPAGYTVRFHDLKDGSSGAMGSEIVRPKPRVRGGTVAWRDNWFASLAPNMLRARSQASNGMFLVPLGLAPGPIVLGPAGDLTTFRAMPNGESEIWEWDGDSDDDTIRNPRDNCVAHANPNQVDVDRDGFGNRCDPDFDDNHRVDTQDRDELLSRLGGSEAEYDLNGDGAIDQADVAILDGFLHGPPGPTGQLPILAQTPRAPPTIQFVSPVGGPVYAFRPISVGWSATDADRYELQYRIETKRRGKRWKISRWFPIASDLATEGYTWVSPNIPRSKSRVKQLLRFRVVATQANDAASAETISWRYLIR